MEKFIFQVSNEFEERFFSYSEHAELVIVLKRFFARSPLRL